MVSIANDAMNALRRAHAERSGDVDLGIFLSRFSDLGDDELADLIELDARERLRAGLPVELPRYLEAIPDLSARRVALDAAIEFALRSLSGSRHTKIEAVEALCEAYPDLVPAISAAWFLNDALGSTAGASALVQPPAEIRLPMSVGPVLPSGSQRYELRERVGVGSHSSVYLAVDHALSEADRPAWVAVKITAGVTGSHALSHRVMEEATKARRVTHPNIARVLDRGALDSGGEFIVYEHVDAGDLQDAHDRGRLPRDHRALAALVVKISRAVQAAHSAGLIHSDLKPSNILLTSAGEPKVADFGLAARRFDLGESAGGVQLGTLGFMAPERYRAEPGSEGVLSDVYSLGGILYYLLTGRAPNGSTADEVAERLGTDSEPPSFTGDDKDGRVDEDLAAICRRALAPRPSDRYPSADAFANDLDAWLEFRPLAWRNPKPRQLAVLFWRRNPVLCAAGVLLMVAALGTTAGLMQMRSNARTRLLRMELDNKKKIEVTQRESAENAKFMAGGMASILLTKRADFGADWVPFLTIAESVGGPALLNSSDAQGLAILWQSRIDVAREIIAEARAHHAENDSEILLWRIGLGFWLLRSGENFAEARQTLDEAAKEWAARFGEGDTWAVYARTLSACAAIREIQKRVADGQVSEADRETLLSRASLIIGSLPRFTGSRAGTNIHREMLGVLVDVHSPELLGDAALKEKYAEDLRVLKKK